ncbi:DoxX family protein [Flavobacterium sp. N502536]|uniref:DoxX family protein n=1 Tax=Flavobacterium sp. N502536 TaxID=2986837 RepID=UPI0022220EBA|nr:DoxX family protein [Flavobacterium sp. N502536]
MKKDKILFWTTTIIIFIMEGIIPALTSQTELAKQGISHMQYPAYFGNALVVFKVIGALTVIIPQAPKFAKEWAYTGFGFVFIFASISHFAVDGFGFQAILPLVFLGILVISYKLYQKLYQKEYAVSAAY